MYKDPRKELGQNWFVIIWEEEMVSLHKKSSIH